MIMRVTFVLLSVWLLLYTRLQAQSICAGDLMNSGIVTYNLYERAITSFHKAVPVSSYTPAQKQAQQSINRQVAQAVVTYVPVADADAWTAIDKEDITPLTWKWVDLQQVRGNGDTSWISLRRPVWWLHENKAGHSGDSVYVNMPEMGILGWATVTDIRPNQVDTRLWETYEQDGYKAMPVTGKFTHRSSDVYDLYFDGNDKSLGVTGNHRIFSASRNAWLEAAQLTLGERVMTTDSDHPVALIKKEKRTGTHTVYNIEVYRAHNYHVSESEILVHNDCWRDLFIDAIETSRITSRIRWKGPDRREVQEIFLKKHRYQSSESIVDEIYKRYTAYLHPDDNLKYEVKIDVTEMTRENIEKIVKLAKNTFVIESEDVIEVDGAKYRLLHLSKIKGGYGHYNSDYRHNRPDK